VGRRLGLFIGINQYQDPTFRPLQYAETDAKAFARWLQDPRGGAWHPTEVYVATGQEATKERLGAQLMQLCVTRQRQRTSFFSISPDTLL
jgi:hypothetical protein